MNKSKKYADSINYYGTKIERLGFKEIWRLIQQWVNQDKHPRAIEETLRMGFPYLKTARNKEKYLRGIMKTKAQNWREKEAIRQHEKNKAMWDDLVLKLKNVHNSECQNDEGNGDG